MIGYGSDGQWWTTVATDGGGRWQWTVVKVNRKRIYEVGKIVVRRYKIEGKKLRRNKTNLKLVNWFFLELVLGPNWFK